MCVGGFHWGVDFFLPPPTLITRDSEILKMGGCWEPAVPAGRGGGETMRGSVGHPPAACPGGS